MTTIRQLAGAVDNALTDLAEAIDDLAAMAQTKDRTFRTQNHGQPSPTYESIGGKIVVAAGSSLTLTKYLGVPVHRGVTTLAALFPVDD